MSLPFPHTWLIGTWHIAWYGGRAVWITAANWEGGSFPLEDFERKVSPLNSLTREHAGKVAKLYAERF